MRDIIPAPSLFSSPIHVTWGGNLDDGLTLCAPYCVLVLMGCANPEAANHSLISKSFLRACCVLATILSAGDTLVTKSLLESLILVGEGDNKSAKK